MLQWLNDVVQIGKACREDKRAIVIFTHHQYFGLESPYYGTPRQLGAIIPSGCTVLWIDGHEHGRLVGGQSWVVDRWLVVGRWVDG